ncbi:MAG TPA: hypothetical protein VII58_04150 [Acidobacteriaceae bacterium]
MKKRFVCSRFLTTVGLFALLPHLHSQEIAHDTPATIAQLNEWLHNNDSRLVAWAATLARERQQDAFISLLPDWLKQSPLIQDYGYSPNREDSRAYDAVLDALIRGGSQPTVEPSVLRDLARTYPIQAFLLLDRLPAEQQLPVLKEWFSVAELDSRHSQLARLAAMRLAQWPTPVPGFAARILTAAEEQLTIDLLPRSGTGSGYGSMSCGDSLYTPPTAGWPIVYLPIVEEGNDHTRDATLIALDDDHITYRWVEENSPGGTCHGLRGLDQGLRHTIVAHWLKQPPKTMQWQVAQTVPVVWTNRAAFDLEVGRLIESEEENFATMANDLGQAGLLSQEEATWVRPKLVVRVVCDIDPCPILGASKGRQIEDLDIPS